MFWLRIQGNEAEIESGFIILFLSLFNDGENWDLWSSSKLYKRSDAIFKIKLIRSDSA